MHLVALSNCLVATIPPVPMLRLMQQEISFAGSVARELAGRDLIKVTGREVAILDRDALARIAGIAA